MIRNILGYIDNYLTGQVSLRDLETFVVSNLQTILRSGDKMASELANQVDADLVELGENLLSEEMLRKRWELYLSIRETLTLKLLDAERAESTSISSTSSETVFAESTVTPIVDLHLGQVVFA